MGKSKPKAIVNELENIDVLFFGEEHNDSIGHQLQTVLFKMMFDNFGEKQLCRWKCLTEMCNTSWMNTKWFYKRELFQQRFQKVEKLQ